MAKLVDFACFLAHLLLFQGLAAFLKAIGFLIPLMDAEYAGFYTREMMNTLIREFSSPDEEMKKIVLKVRCYLLYTDDAFYAGGKAVLCDRWCRAVVYSRGHTATVLQKLLEYCEFIFFYFHD